jgi:hypothetical protein
VSNTDIYRGMDTVHPHLVPKVYAVLNEVNAHLPSGWVLCIFETSRTAERQLMLFRTGKSKIKTAKGKHCVKPQAEAVDVVFKHGGQWTWEDPVCSDGRRGWALVDSSAKGHNLRRISWDRPHLELKPEDR